MNHRAKTFGDADTIQLNKNTFTKSLIPTISIIKTVSIVITTANAIDTTFSMFTTLFTIFFMINSPFIL